MLQVGPWLPDQADYQGTASNEALNVIPAVSTYRPFPQFASITNALGARCQGAVFVRRADGTGTMFAGDATKLYQLSATTWSDVSRLAGGPYSTPADGRWTFVQFGSMIYANNGLDAPQQFNIDADSNFSAQTGSPPTALYGAVVGDFEVLGNQGVFRNRMQWSPINAPGNSWAASQVTQASSQDLPDGGWIQGITALEYNGTIYQEFAVRTMTYVGTPLIFQFRKVASDVGASIVGSIASYREFAFFVHRSGFFMVTNGYQLNPIGVQKVDNEFWNSVNQSYLHRVTSAIDPVNCLYMIAFPNQSSSNGDPNEIYIYNWVVDKWAHIQGITMDMIFSAATQTGFTLEQLDTISTNLDALPFSLDSQVWAGVARQLVGGFGIDHKLGFFNGAAMAATVDTTEDEPVPGRKAFLRQLRPMVDGGTPSIALGTRNRQMDPVVYSTGVVVDSLGFCKFRKKARYYRGRITVPAGQTWTHILGIDDIKSTQIGVR
jgi:hypothetical protein